MEVLGTIGTGLALFGCGHYLGFKLGRKHEKAIALIFTAHVTELLGKRLGLSEREILGHLKSIKEEVAASKAD